MKKAILFLLFQAVFQGYAGPELKTHTGNATYYANKFQHRHTSNGERYSKDSLTCATRLYPFGTMLLVTNLKNDKKVLVRVNDRCPYRRNRIVDLSKAAASQIDMLKEGRVKVKLEPLADEEVIAAKTAPAIKDTIKPKVKIMRPDLESIAGKYGVQVNAFADKKNIKHELVKLKRKGYDNIFTRPGVYKKQKVTKVIIGPYESKGEAKAALQQILENGFKMAILVKL